MPMWGWILIAVAVIALILLIVWATTSKRRTHQLQERFGPEYERAMHERGSRRAAESDLDERRKRREQLEIRPLSPDARHRYAQSWQATQGRFVDDPSGTVREADVLVISVMRDRGYPMENFEQRAADVSVDHPQLVDNYRAAHGISLANDQGVATTEDLRQAMVYYRSLFDELLSGGYEMPAAGAR
jgi:FtsZ-interacting cell division protein ZipA